MPGDVLPSRSAPHGGGLGERASRPVAALSPSGAAGAALPPPCRPPPAEAEAATPRASAVPVAARPVLAAAPGPSPAMAVRASFENNNELGCFAKLTNAYCLVAIGGSENFYR